MLRSTAPTGAVTRRCVLLMDKKDKPKPGKPKK
jgi:hypothetical protein